MKKMFCSLMAMALFLVPLTLHSVAHAGPCAHENKEFMIQIQDGPHAEGSVHKTYYLNLYVCLFCNETVEEVAAVDVDGHTFVRDSHAHVSHGVHEIYYDCFCGATYTERMECYGPPCVVNYFSLKPEVVTE